MDFLCEQTEDGLDQRKGLGPIFHFKAVLLRRASLWVWLWPAEDAVSPQMGFPASACSSIPICRLEKKMGFSPFPRKKTRKGIQSDYKNLNGATSPTYSLLLIFIALLQMMKTWTCVSITPAHELTAHPLTGLDNPKSHLCYLLCWASWKHFLKKTKIFGGFRAVISNQ